MGHCLSVSLGAPNRARNSLHQAVLQMVSLEAVVPKEQGVITLQIFGYITGDVWSSQTSHPELGHDRLEAGKDRSYGLGQSHGTGVGEHRTWPDLCRATCLLQKVRNRWLRGSLFLSLKMLPFIRGARSVVQLPKTECVVSFLFPDSKKN